jgi:hypothetical protein
VPRTSFVTRYDFRAPGATPEERRELFARALEQAAYVDRHGQDALMLSEHHLSADGYLPSPIPVAAAFAAVTSRQLTSASMGARYFSPARLVWPDSSGPIRLAPSRDQLHVKPLTNRGCQRIGIPEIARAITSRWISEVPSKIV